MKTILVVDDSETQLSLYKYELSPEGYIIITANNGYEAIKKAKECSPDLIIMDINMPKMDGIESIGKILSERKKIPIIINTGYSTYNDKYMTWLADAFITKSSDLSELKNKIKELIGQE